MNALLILLLMIAPLSALAVWSKAYPHRPLVLLALIPGILSFAVIGQSNAEYVVAAVDAAVLLAAAIDFFSLPRQTNFSVERETGRIASIAKQHEVTLTLANHSPREQLVWLRDCRPDDFAAEPEQFLLRVPARNRTTVRYQLTSRRRGAFKLDKIFVRARGRWGLWHRYLEYPLAHDVNVYPNMLQLSEYAVLARTNRLSLMGVRRTRKIGQDNNFERLRDYSVDDNFKHIDWRSTARRNKLTVRDFQANQSQRIIFLIDCGRMMAGMSAGLSLLDHSLNAMLMLSYVALRQGDSVGLLAFSNEILGYVPPRGGMNQMNRLLHASFDRFPRLVESRYDEAFLYLARQCRKRSLVILITNVIDEVNARQVESYLRGLSGRHLPLGVLLRDHGLFDAVEAAQTAGVANLEQLDSAALFRSAAAADILLWRAQVLRDLESRGAMTLDVFPEQMTAPLVNRYLDVKARRLL